jgi:conjugative coupling factor TraD (TOL family)
MALPIENLLRKPAEMYSVLACVGASVLILSAPGLVYMNSSSALVGAGLLWSLGAVRFKQALRLKRYQRNLGVLPRYQLSGDEIPMSHEHLFIGKGFRWDMRHTMRMTQLQDPEALKLLRPTPLQNAAFKLDKRLEHHAWAQSFRQWLKYDAAWNPLQPRPKVGGSSALHGVGMWEGEDDQWMDLSERVGHTVVLGTTRVGKSRLAEILIAQDIARGNVVIVIDPKGDAELMKRVYIEARRAGRADQLYVFHLGRPDISARYNPLDSFDRITEVATRIANQLPGEGQSAAFKEFVWRFVNVIARTMSSLGDRISYLEIYRTAGAPGKLAIRYFETVLNKQLPNWQNDFDRPFEIAQEKKEEGQQDDELTAALRRGVAAARSSKREARALALAEFLSFKEVNDDIANSLATMLTNDRSYLDKLVSSLYPLLEKLTTGRVSELLSPNYNDPHDKRPIFTWSDVINRGGIVYVGLDSLSDYEVGGVVGNAMFSDLTSLAGKDYNYGFTHGQARPSAARKVSIHADEFNELVGDEFVPMVNKAGGAGYEVTVYTQTWADVEAKIGSKPKSEQIAGNLNTMIMLRVKTTDTAEMLTNQLPEVDIPSKLLDSSATDVSDPDDFTDFRSKNQDRIQMVAKPMLTTADLTQLPKGQAFALIEGGQLFKLRFPLPDSSADGDIPNDIADLAFTMRQTYKTHYLNALSTFEADETDVDTAVGSEDLSHEFVGMDPVDIAMHHASLPEAASTPRH